MKKIITLGIMLSSMMMLFSGCSKLELKDKEAVATVSETEGVATTEVATEDEVTTESAESTSDVPVLGKEDIEGYEGFEYLYEEILLAETEENKDTGKKERKMITVYLPEDEYTKADGNYARANTLGVSFRVELEPYLSYDQDDYLPEENLQKYMDDEFNPFYTAEYKDLVVSEVQEMGNGYGATAEYCRYNEWDEEYYAIFCTYYYVELESGEMVFVKTEVNSSEVTGKTPSLIEELEQFYQFEVNWDKEEAEKKCANCAENGTANMFSTGNLLFELPQGWKKDRDVSSIDNEAYAPDGDSTSAGCLLLIKEDYVGYGEEVDLNMFLEKEQEEAIKEAMGVAASNYVAEKCETGIGDAIKITCNVSENGEKASVVMYIVMSDYRLYEFVAMDMSGATESAAEALENIVQNGQIRK